ncbi:MAG: thiamine biosynthesis protein ThiF [Sulfurimonas sp.]|uniref:thiamine biosynthesis protein ThiF n=1 Tax=Sulfurimonas sp. TaxID=2022749 RepID=UPI0025D089F9|nr:thiamine biosynthesis protein ThiF [Sulfurimonas sp.]MCK9492183.1 thiamine biosynthesis protein ThiF [Sulfurimonas sp.]
MSHGFDLDRDLVCEGIIGDGCGGGRFFMVKDEILKAYDPDTKEYIELLVGVKNALTISKSVCVLNIVCQDETIEFDLSKMKRV